METVAPPAIHNRPQKITEIRRRKAYDLDVVEVIETRIKLAGHPHEEMTLGGRTGIGELEIEIMELPEDLSLVVGFSHNAGPTHEQVEGVRSRYDKDSNRYDALFDQIDDISRAGAVALRARRYDDLGHLMNVCHGLLNAIEVSTPDLDNMIGIARKSGAVGAKLTGAGGGGSIVALCPGTEEDVRSALNAAGYETLRSANSRAVAT